jgi:hypothetical protein
MGTSGEKPGANGGAPDGPLRAPGLAYLGLGLFILGVDTVNALSALQDLKGRVQGWEPYVWEYSSGTMSLLLLPFVALMVRIAPLSRRYWWRFGLVHGLGALIYSLIHVGGFVILRKLVYAEFGRPYVFGGFSRFIYEFRKDILGYVICVTVFALSARRRSAASPSASAENPPHSPGATDPPTFDIREGARLIRVRPAEIITAMAAGNYVEFRLQDGRRPLMRTTLSRVEATLSAHGFVRTHRSWLVNAAHLRSVEAEGSGDYQLELDDGVQAPLSRRFPEALARLRQG